jgi:hypothetical protein
LKILIFIPTPLLSLIFSILFMGNTLYIAAGSPFPNFASGARGSFRYASLRFAALKRTNLGTVSFSVFSAFRFLSLFWISEGNCGICY